MRVVKSFGGARHERTKFNQSAGAVVTNFVIANRMLVTRESLVTFLFAVPTGVMLLYGGWLVLRGFVTPGTLASFVIYMVMLSEAIHLLEWQVQIFARAMAAGQRIFEVLDSESLVKDARVHACCPLRMATSCSRMVSSIVVTTLRPYMMWTSSCRTVRPSLC